MTMMRDAAREVSAAELDRMAQSLRMEERLTWLFAQGAEQCRNPQLQSFFAHLSDASGDRTVQLAETLRGLAGAGREAL